MDRRRRAECHAPLEGPPGGNVLGIHWGPQEIDHNALLAALTRLNAKGRYPRGILHLGAPGNASIASINQASPKALVIHRIIDGGNYNNFPDVPYSELTYQKGYDWFEYVFARYVASDPDVQRADVLALYNEWDEAGSYLSSVNEWTRGAMDAAFRRGKRITLYNFNPGFPAYPHQLEKPDRDFWVRPATIANLRQAKAQRHVVAIHGYDLFNAGNWTGLDDCLRHIKIRKLLPPDLQIGLKWAITEFGDALLNQVGSDIFTVRARGAIAATQDDPDVLLCTWTFGISSEQWRGSNGARHIQAYETILGA